METINDYYKRMVELWSPLATNFWHAIKYHRPQVHLAATDRHHTHIQIGFFNSRSVGTNLTHLTASKSLATFFNTILRYTQVQRHHTARVYLRLQWYKSIFAVHNFIFDLQKSNIMKIRKKARRKMKIAKTMVCTTEKMQLLMVVGTVFILRAHIVLVQ